MLLKSLFSVITAATALLPTAHAGTSHGALKTCHYKILRLNHHKWEDRGEGSASPGSTQTIEGTEVKFSKDCLPSHKNRGLYIEMKTPSFQPA
ncbi:hypothetical protein PpBr36_02468 [Pyricularia pennisetigena]|uniref:hypothetical protein n=1 Tax=Pyricularia pennisetigena TaxID=1578925 RepID=UPI001150B067|nr:hypothetical protein PpBr36_02468 [Pyricularia pennisetigena]TLS30446.1 hypothetical protein PpBr36_02468 [Pyricularia pennisetigena]